MYQGYTESAEKIEARKRRILKGYQPPRRPTPSTHNTPGKSLSKFSTKKEL